MSEPDWENFAKAVLTDWPTGDLDGSVLFDLSLQYGMIQEVPGGYNSDHHIDAEGICPEEGDPWYEYTFRGEAGPGLYSINDMTATNEQLSNCVAVLEADLRKMALDYLAAQGQASENFQMYVDANEARIDAETSLAKAVEALDEAWYMLTVPHLNYEPDPEEPGLRRIKTALAELKERTSGLRPLMSGAKK